jgi:hypothetical protein
MNILRLFLATVAAKDLKYFQFDIKNIFTEAHLKETIYLILLKGVPYKKEHVFKVLCSLYSLKQAAWDWNILIKRELIK